MSEFSEFLAAIADGKKQATESSPGKSRLKQIKEEVHKDNPFLNLPTKPKEEETVPEVIQEEAPILQEVVVPEIKPAAQQYTAAEINKYLKRDASFQQPEPDKADPNISAIQTKLKFLEQAIGKIAALGPGSGEVNLRWLDDVDRPTIYDMRYLRYSESKKKFEFAEVNPHDIVYTTTLVTTPTYTVADEDYYIGVNYAGPVTITLPATPSSGRKIIIKDESGNASTNPITVTGTVDNDSGGFIIQLDNGAIQMIYRSGWRIV